MYTQELVTILASDGKTFRTTERFSGPLRIGVSVSLPPKCVDYELQVDIPLDQLIFFFMVSQAPSSPRPPGEGLAVKVNTTKSPKQTFRLEPGVPIVWSDGRQLPPPFIENVKKLFVSSPNDAPVDFSIEGLCRMNSLDRTPSED